MMNLIELLFNILPDVILLGGPFCVFAGMGTGSNTGKLNFRQICSEGGITVTESTDYLDIKSSGGGGAGAGAIGSYKIATGNTTGITPSLIYFNDYSGCSIERISIIGGFTAGNVTTADYRGMIIGGCANSINDFNCNSVIIGGARNCSGTSGYLNQNSIILNSEDALIRNGFANTIINSSSASAICGIETLGGGGLGYHSVVNSEKSLICEVNNGQSNSIFNSSCGLITDSYKSVIMSGCLNILKKMRYSSIFNGRQNQITDNDYYGYNNSIINGRANLIRCAYLRENFIINGCGNRIYAIVKGSTIVGNSIINGKGNKVKYTSYNNSIVNGSENQIECSNYSSILNGFQNCIIPYGFGSPYLQLSTIAGSCLSKIGSSEESSIFGSIRSSNLYNRNSTIINSNSSRLDCSNQSTLIGGITGSCIESIQDRMGNTLIGGSYNKIINSCFSFLSSYCCNTICGPDPNYHNFLLGICDNTISRGNFSSIIGGYKENLISNALHSSIIGGDFATLSNSSYSSVLSGRGNKSSNTCASLILAGSNNTLIQSSNSAIVGSCQARLCNVQNTVISSGLNFKCSTGSCNFLDNTLYVCKLQMLGTASTSSPFRQGVTCTGLTSISQIIVCRGIVVSVTP